MYLSKHEEDILMHNEDIINKIINDLDKTIKWMEIYKECKKNILSLDENLDKKELKCMVKLSIITCLLST